MSFSKTFDLVVERSGKELRSWVCPVVVERYYYQEPVYYVTPPPSGYFYGMSVMEPGMAFSFGVSGR